jgi:hypothetical protein
MNVGDIAQELKPGYIILQRLLLDWDSVTHKAPVNIAVGSSMSFVTRG